MKKSLIAVSVAAALGGVAGSAVAQGVPPASERVFNRDGVGHALIVPYFNTQGGNATLLNIVNTDLVNGKAIKIRFRGASNSDDVFDFQVFLSPGDVWTAGIAKGPNGVSRLTTADKSCTVPSAIKNPLGNDFVTLRLNQRLSGEALQSETREGYVEIFNMGDIYPTDNDLFDTVKHDAGVPECDPVILDSLTYQDTQLTYPTTGLFANWTIINVPQTTTWTGDALALEARVCAGPAQQCEPGYGELVYFPQLDLPASALVTVSNFTADPLFRKGIIPAAQYDLPDLSTPYLPANPSSPQINANDLSAAIAGTAWGGEFLTNPAILASTDWVVSSPTRRYYIAVDYSPTAPVLVDNFNDNSDPTAVFYRKRTATLTAGNVSLTGYQGCAILASQGYRDQEETPTTPQGPVISPGTAAAAPSLCGEVSTVSFNGIAVPSGSVTASANTTPESTTLKSKVARTNVALPFTDGWGFVTQPNNNINGRSYGLPLVVNQFARAVNPGATPGVSGTYAATWPGRVLGRGDEPPLPSP